MFKEIRNLLIDVLVLVLLLYVQHEHISLFIQAIYWLGLSLVFIVAVAAPKTITDNWEKGKVKHKSIFKYLITAVFIGSFIYLGYVFLAVLYLATVYVMYSVRNDFINQK